MQSDTIVVDAKSGSLPSNYFKYFNVDHDIDTVSRDNILVGEVGFDVVRCVVRNSFPLRDSTVAGQLQLDNQTETVIDTQDTWVKINGASTLAAESERISKVSDATLRYDGIADDKIDATKQSTFRGASNETYEVGLFKNGTLIPETLQRIEGEGQNKPKPSNTKAFISVSNNDEVSIRVRNIDATGNITFDNYVLTVDKI